MQCMTRAEGMERDRWWYWKWNELAPTVAVLVLATWNAGVSGESSSLCREKGRWAERHCGSYLWIYWIAVTAKAMWEWWRDDKCNQRHETKGRNTETMRKLRAKHGNEGKHFSDLFKLSTCRFYTKMTCSNPKAQSRAKRRSKQRIKGWK